MNFFYQLEFIAIGSRDAFFVDKIFAFDRRSRHLVLLVTAAVASGRASKGRGERIDRGSPDLLSSR